MKEQEKYWNYRAPPTPELADLPKGSFAGSEKEWNSLSPGYRRAIYKEIINMAKKKITLPVKEDMRTTDPLELPKFLDRRGKIPRLTNEEAAKLSEPTTNWKPFRDYKSEEYKAARAEARKPVIFVKDPELFVTVVTRESRKPKTLARYDNIAQFMEKHDFTTWPFKQCVSTSDENLIEVTAKPWANKDAGSGTEKTPRAPKLTGKSKNEIVAELLAKSEGTTKEEILEATGWPSVSVPRQAAWAKMKLIKERVDGVTRYWGKK